MSYIEDQRKKVVEHRDSIFRDPGEGVFYKKERDFVLKNPVLNLWAGIRDDAIEYFSRNSVVWWPSSDIPTGHLLSSQIACVNHLFPLRQRQDLAIQVLKQVSLDFVSAVIVDVGFVEFEVIGAENYLGEKSHQRGANSTSIDAVMIGEKPDGSRTLVGIEWKYTESYTSESKYIPRRSETYDHLIHADSSPIRIDDPSKLYYEPFYQLMRQILLLSLMVANTEYGCSDFIHVHVIPSDNVDLRDRITSPKLPGENLSDAWKNVLKDESKYIVLSPDQLLSQIVNCNDALSIFEYLRRRYWL